MAARQTISITEVKLMGDRIAVLSSGIWKNRELVGLLTGLEPVRWGLIHGRPECDFITGWGKKPTSNKARHLAEKLDMKYIAMEDGFLRSVKPGPDQKPISLIVDRTGIYYDATSPSDLENLIISRAENPNPQLEARARAGMDILREHKISKYNHAPYLSADEMGLDPSISNAERVLLIDQTQGDASVEYGMATSATFKKMLDRALAENPAAEIIVKTHPDVIDLRKKGYLTGFRDRRVKLISNLVNPWSLIDLVGKVYVVSSQLGFEALLAGRDVTCFGTPFYAGWGLTDDRAEVPRRRSARPTREQVFLAAYFDYARYVSPDTLREITFEDAVELIIKGREILLRGSIREPLRG